MTPWGQKTPPTRIRGELRPFPQLALYRIPPNGGHCYTPDRRYRTQNQHSADHMLTSSRCLPRPPNEGEFRAIRERGNPNVSCITKQGTNWLVLKRLSVAGFEAPNDRRGENPHRKVPSVVPRGAHYGARQSAAKMFRLHHFATKTAFRRSRQVLVTFGVRDACGCGATTWN